MNRFFIADFEGDPGYLVTDEEGKALYFTMDGEPLSDVGARIVENDVPAPAWWKPQTIVSNADDMSGADSEAGNA